MKTLKQTYLIEAPIEEVWQALVDPTIIDKWGGGPAKMNDKVGAKFTLWGGDVHGINTKVAAYKELAQDWFGGDWKEPSKVTFTLNKKNNQTEIVLLHENIPDNEVDDIDDGWKEYYLGPLKELLEQ